MEIVAAQGWISRGLRARCGEIVSRCGIGQPDSLDLQYALLLIHRIGFQNGRFALRCRMYEAALGGIRLP